MEFGNAYRKWRFQLVKKFSGGLETGELYEECARCMESENHGRGSRYYIWAANKYLHAGNKDKFIFCIRRAWEIMQTKAYDYLPADFALLASNPDKTWELAAKDSEAEALAEGIGFSSLSN